MNKKILNATPKIYNGIKYRSTLEARVAQYLTEHSIDFKYEETKFELLPKIKYNNETIRAVHYTPDFICKNVIIEVKGFPNDRWPLTKKLIIHKIINDKLPYHFTEIHSIRELQKVIEEFNINK